MILVDVEKLKRSTIIKIGEDLGILPPYSCVTDENVDKVIEANIFYLDLILPYKAVKAEIDQGKLKVEVYE